MWTLRDIKDSDYQLASCQQQLEIRAIRNSLGERNQNFERISYKPAHVSTAIMDIMCLTNKFPQHPANFVRCYMVAKQLGIPHVIRRCVLIWIEEKRSHFEDPDNCGLPFTVATLLRYGGRMNFIRLLLGVSLITDGRQIINLSHCPAAFLLQKGLQTHLCSCYQYRASTSLYFLSDRHT